MACAGCEVCAGILCVVCRTEELLLFLLQRHQVLAGTGLAILVSGRKCFWV